MTYGQILESPDGGRIAISSPGSVTFAGGIVLDCECNICWGI